MVRGMVGRGKKKEKNGVPPPQPPPPLPSTSTTKHAKIMPSFSCSPPTERKDSKPAAITANTADHSLGSPPARRHPPKRIPSGKSPGNPGVVRTDLAMWVFVLLKLIICCGWKDTMIDLTMFGSSKWRILKMRAWDSRVNPLLPQPPFATFRNVSPTNVTS